MLVTIAPVTGGDTLVVAAPELSISTVSLTVGLVRTIRTVAGLVTDFRDVDTLLSGESQTFYIICITYNYFSVPALLSEC